METGSPENTGTAGHERAGDEPGWTGLPPGLLRMRRLLLVVWLGLLTIGLAVLLNLLAGPSWAAFALLPPALMAWGWVMLGRNWRSWRYAERADDLLISRGVLWREETVVPYGRMQLVEVTSGPVERHFGLASVQLHGGRRDRRHDPRPGPGGGGTAARPAHRAGRGTIGGPVTTPGVDDAVRERRPVTERRLHPVTPLRRAWAPVAVLIGWAVHDPDQAQRQLTRLTTTTLLIAVAVLLPAAALYGFLTWWFTHFAVTDAELRIRTGLVFRRTAHIRLERIQAIDVTQPLLARVAGVAKLKLDVLGTGKKDELAFLGAQEARALRAELLARAAGFAPRRRTR